MVASFRPFTWLARHPHSTDVGLALVLGVVTLVFLLFLAPLDPDPHHDGYQFAIALAVSEGLRPHVDVFSQYGPFTAEVQGLFLRITEPSLLMLRYLNAAVLALVAVTGFVIARQVRLSRFISVLVVLVWVALCPAGGVYSDALQLWPWSSGIFTLFAQLGVLLVLMSINGGSRRWVWFAAGFVLVLTIWIRITQGFPLLLAVVLALLVKPETRDALRRNIAAFAGGGGAALVLGALYFIVRSDFQLFVTDALLGPFNRFVVEDFDGSDRVLAPVDLAAVLSQSYVLASLPLLALGALLFAFLRRSWKSWIVPTAMGLVTALVITVFASAGYFGRTRDFLVSAMSLDLPTGPLNALSASPLYVSWLLSLGFTVFVALRFLLRQPVRQASASVVTLFAASAFSTQVVPRWDVYHLWWAGPLLMIASLAIILNFLSRSNGKFFVVALLVPYLVLGIYSTQNVMSQERVEVTSGSLKGMRVLPTRDSAAQAIHQLGEILPPRSTRVLCSDGLYAAPGSHFISISSNFVPWGWSRGTELLSDPEFILICGDEPGDFERVADLIPLNYELVEADSSMALSPWSQTEFRLYRIRR